MTRHSRKRGFSLIEAAIVLAVVGLVIGGIWVAAAKVNDSIKWRQTEEGWLYYVRLTTENFNARNARHEDIDYTFLSHFPLPAGWKLTGSQKRPTDPYGNRFYAQTQAMGTFSMGYTYQIIRKDVCVKVEQLMFLEIARMHKIYSTHGNRACATDISKCCESHSSPGAYLWLPG